MAYNIQDHPDLQNGWTLGGTITTDGNLGVLTAGDILSWSVTLSNGSSTETFTDLGQNVGAFGGPSTFYGLTATSTQLYVPIPPVNGPSTGIDLGIAVPSNRLLDTYVGWDRLGDPFQSMYYALKPQTAFLWHDTGNSLNRFDWVVAIAPVPSAVPEPSSFALLGLGGIGLAFGVYRRRRLDAAV